MDIREIEGKLNTSGCQVCLVIAKWNKHIVDKLESGALSLLQNNGMRKDSIDIVRVPGAFEIPLAVEYAIKKNKYDAIIALGAVIRGDTPHFEYVAGECVKGLSHASIKHGLPVSFGVLTVDNIEQAIERSGENAGNKGAEAAAAAIEMANLIKELK